MCIENTEKVFRNCSPNGYQHRQQCTAWIRLYNLCNRWRTYTCIVLSIRIIYKERQSRGYWVVSNDASIIHTAHYKIYVSIH